MNSINLNGNYRNVGDIRVPWRRRRICVPEELSPRRRCRSENRCVTESDNPTTINGTILTRIHHVMIVRYGKESGSVWLAAWHLPGGPVGPPSRWAATSNVEV